MSRTGACSAAQDGAIWFTRLSHRKADRRSTRMSSRRGALCRLTAVYGKPAPLQMREVVWLGDGRRYLASLGLGHACCIPNADGTVQNSGGPHPVAGSEQGGDGGHRDHVQQLEVELPPDANGAIIRG